MQPAMAIVVPIADGGGSFCNCYNKQFAAPKHRSGLLLIIGRMKKQCCPQSLQVLQKNKPSENLIFRFQQPPPPMHSNGIKNLFFGALLLGFNYAVAQKNTDQVFVIKSQRKASNAAIAKHDVEGIAKFWLPDFIQVRGNGTYLVGKDAIINTWTELFTNSPEVAYVRNPSEIIISKNDSLAWEKGKWVAIKSYSKGGNYSAMWRKVNKEWKLQAEIFVSLY